MPGKPKTRRPGIISHAEATKNQPPMTAELFWAQRDASLKGTKYDRPMAGVKLPSLEELRAKMAAEAEKPPVN